MVSGQSITGPDELARGDYRVERFLYVGAMFLLSGAAAAAIWCRDHYHTHNVRIAYGIHHLPGALFWALGFLLFVGACRIALPRVRNLEELPSAYFVLGLVAVFCIFWLPPVLASSFNADDWMLLAAASVRKSILLHPELSWKALDSVDGNFRPLGTVLYMGAMFNRFGVSARPFLLGLFGFNLLATLVIFPVVRELGYGRVTAAAAGLIYLSRSLTYTINTWVSALGDTLVILLCGLMAWALLRAMRIGGFAAWPLYMLAWTLFMVATLAKQSAFAVPMIVALLLFMRPGKVSSASLGKRVGAALVGLVVYGAGAAIVYLHAKSLTRGDVPYPLRLSLASAMRTFSFAAWYLGTFDFPPYMTQLQVLPPLAGLFIVCGCVLLARKFPAMLGERPRDVAFCLLSALASVSLFVLLPDRGAAYYGSMAAFWISMALAIGLTRFARHTLASRGAIIVFCALLVAGFTDARLKQTGLLPSGGYTWGTSGAAMEDPIFDHLQQALARSPDTQTLVLVDMPVKPSVFACMAILLDPKLERIVAFNTKTRRYTLNDLRGGLPRDGVTPLNDAGAYHWTVPLPESEAAQLLSGPGVLRVLPEAKRVYTPQ